MRASLLCQLPGRGSEAEGAYRGLIATNPDHVHWHAALHGLLGLKV